MKIFFKKGIYEKEQNTSRVLRASILTIWKQRRYNKHFIMRVTFSRIQGARQREMGPDFCVVFCQNFKLLMT